MKKVLFVIFCLLPSLLYAQVMKERRVYYLDCSYSMIQHNLKDKVCNNLIKAIDSVEDATTELMVIPFAFNADQNAQLKPFSEKATPSGKAKLIAEIKGINWIKGTMTYHKDPIEDFYNNKRMLQNGITYMFLMTDGQDEWPDPNRFLNDLRDWKGMYKYDTKNVYGFYVMLDAAAKNADVEKIINQDNDHFWTVNSADVNIHITRAENEGIFNIRTEQYVDIPVYGPTRGYDINVSTNSNYYKIRSFNFTGDGKLRLYIDGKIDRSSLPQSDTMCVKISVNNSPSQFDFWVTNNINIKCNNKQEPAIISYKIK